MDNYATPPATPRRVPEKERPDSEDASMASADAFPTHFRISDMIESEDEETGCSTVTAGSQTEEAGTSGSGGPVAHWLLDLDTVLNIDIDDVHHIEDDQEEERTLVEEIERKYGSVEGLFTAGSTFVSPVKGRGGPGGGLPGKRGASGSLLILVLNHRRISQPGPFHRLRDLASNLHELDLAGNHLTWPHVAKILSVTQGLSHCNLSSNQLGEPFDFPATTSFPYLRSLVLNSTHIHWPTLFSLLRVMPYVEELHLSLNDYSGSDEGLSRCLRTFPALHTLHLSQCGIRSWEGLERILRHFPCLEDLVCADNPIPTFGPPQLPLPQLRLHLGDLLGCLRSLNCNGWDLDSWEDVDRVTALPLLSDLRLNHVPLLDRIPESEGRIHVLARLPAVASYNGSDVARDERETAERAFLRHCLPAPEDARPSRYWELERIHGRLEPLANIELRPKATVEVILRYQDRREFHRVALQQSVGQFKKSLLPFCGLSSSRFRLYYHSQATVVFLGREELKLHKLALHSLPLEDGDLFEIEEKPDEVTRRRTSSSQSSVSTSPKSNTHH